MVIVADIEQSDLWTKYAPIALSYGLRACWSVPIFDDARALLGTLALYYRERRAPSTQEIDLIQFASSLAAFVIQRYRDAEKLRMTDARLEAATWGTDVGLWASGIDGDYGWFDNWCERYNIDPCDGPDQDRRWRERIHPDDVERYARITDDAARGVTEHYSVEYRILTREQTLVLVARARQGDRARRQRLRATFRRCVLRDRRTKENRSGSAPG